MPFILGLFIGLAVIVMALVNPKFSGGQRVLGVIAGLAVWVITTVGAAIQTVDAGKVKVLKLFGAQQEGFIPEGLHLINPLATTIEMDTRRRVINFSGQDTIESLSSDNVLMTIDASIPFILNPQMAWKINQRYGPSYEGALILPAARSAVRDAISAQPWNTVTSESGRAQLADLIARRLEQVVRSDLVQAGFSSDEAKATFTFPNVQIRAITPPQRIIDSINEEQAAQADLRRQVTLTQIAEQEAERRANDGLGVRKMMEALPQNYAVEEMVAVINANNGKTAAEAFMKAVESGNPNITVVVASDKQASIAVGKK